MSVPSSLIPALTLLTLLENDPGSVASALHPSKSHLFWPRWGIFDRRNARRDALSSVGLERCALAHCTVQRRIRGHDSRPDGNLRPDRDPGRFRGRGMSAVGHRRVRPQGAWAGRRLTHADRRQPSSTRSPVPSAPTPWWASTAHRRPGETILGTRRIPIAGACPCTHADTFAKTTPILHW